MAKYSYHELANLVASCSDLDNEVKGQIIRILREDRTYGIVWEDNPEASNELLKTEIPVFVEDKGKCILSNNQHSPNHVIIEADNLHAISTLCYTHEGQFDVIYIDPPYNTGAKNWRYNNDYVDGNDSYRHSKWISMMNKRLIIAKTLLKEKGVLICAIDENEVAQLKLLLEKIFGSGYEYVCVTVVHNPRGIQGKNFSYTHEFAIFVIPKGEKIIGGRKIPENEVDWSPLRNWGGESLRTDAKNCFYPIIIKDEKIISFGDVPDNDFHPTKNVHNEDGTISVYPIVDGIEHKWRYARQSVEQIKDLLRVCKKRNIYDIELGKPFGTYKTVWADNRYDANAYGKKLINDIIPDCPFDFPKSIYNVYDCLYSVVGDKKDALILDFFAGSGTTMHATMMMNSEDGGNRRCFLVTNNENNICEDVTYERNRRVIRGYDTPKGQHIDGLSNNSLRYFKTELLSRELSHQNKKNLFYALTDVIRLKDNCFPEQSSFGGLSLIGKSKLVRYFQDSEARVLLIYDTRVIPFVVREIEIMDIPQNGLKIYLFADGAYAYNEEFNDVISKVDLIAMPNALFSALKFVLPKPDEIYINNTTLTDEEISEMAKEIGDNE